MGNYSNAPVDRAAGGFVTTVVDGERHVLVVHRPRFDDWSLPKGHVDEGESWEQTAIREVKEETDLDAIIIGSPLPIAYMVGGEPKVVVFFPMEPADGALIGAGDPNEVDAVAWWPVGTASVELTYADERKVVAALTR